MDDTEEFLDAIPTPTFIRRCLLMDNANWGKVCNKPADWVLRISTMSKLYYVCEKCKKSLYPVEGWKFRRINCDE